MAEFIDAHGNLLKADVEALANSVNTVGVMGKGIALQFKNAFPANFKAYEAACEKQAVRLGEVFVFDNGQLTPPRWIINFPTKGHWRARSRIRDVADGLDDLRHVIEELDISSIALPPLGCGHGGLDWREVRSLIKERLGDLDVVVHLYAPEGAPRRSGHGDIDPTPEADCEHGGTRVGDRPVLTGGAPTSRLSRSTSSCTFLQDGGRGSQVALSGEVLRPLRRQPSPCAQVA